MVPRPSVEEEEFFARPANTVRRHKLGNLNHFSFSSFFFSFLTFFSFFLFFFSFLTFISFSLSCFLLS